MKDGWLEAGHRDRCCIMARTVNTMTGRELRYPEYIVRRGEQSRFFPGNVENGTHGGIIDRWFRDGAFDPKAGC